MRHQVADEYALPGKLRQILAHRRVDADLAASTSFITHGVVAITLVSEAASKIVSSVISSADGRNARLP
jgi:hypothetical protein